MGLVLDFGGLRLCKRGIFTNKMNEISICGDFTFDHLDSSNDNNNRSFLLLKKPKKWLCPFYKLTCWPIVLSTLYRFSVSHPVKTSKTSTVCLTSNWSTWSKYSKECHWNYKNCVTSFKSAKHLPKPTGQSGISWFLWTSWWVSAIFKFWFAIMLPLETQS